MNHLPWLAFLVFVAVEKPNPPTKQEQARNKDYFDNLVTDCETIAIGEAAIAWGLDENWDLATKRARELDEEMETKSREERREFIRKHSVTIDKWKRSFHDRYPEGSLVAEDVSVVAKKASRLLKSKVESQFADKKPTPEYMKANASKLVAEVRAQALKTKSLIELRAAVYKP